MSPQVTIVIPNYNGAHLLKRNLPSVLKSVQEDGVETSVVVVDDGSTDDSLAVLQTEFPGVQVVSHEVNQGFSEAVLSGVKAADTELLLLLNSDVELLPGCLPKLIPYFDHVDTFSVCPLILEEDGTVNRHSWNVRHFRRGNLKAQFWTIDQARAQRERKMLRTLYASGGSMMVRKSMFIKLGGFHPIFKPFYGEDYDLGLRAWRRGWQSYFEPGASLIHQSRGSIKDNVKRDYVKQVRRRNKYLLEWMHLPASRLWLTVIPLSLWQVLGELLLLDKVNLRGFRDALARIGWVLAERRKLKESSVMAFPAILKTTRT